MQQDCLQDQKKQAELYYEKLAVKRASESAYRSSPRFNNGPAPPDPAPNGNNDVFAQAPATRELSLEAKV